MSLLPQELVDQIIDYLHDDIQSLRACSTVCRTWTRSSQRHIFRQISIDLQPFSGILPMFCQSLTSTPHVAECLQHLSISEETSLGRANYPDTLYSIHSLTALFPALVNLTTLSIDFNFSPWEPSHDMENMLRTAVCAPNLIEISLSSISDLLHPRTVLSLFEGSSVKKLYIRDWEKYDDVVEGPVSPSVLLPSISFISLSLNYAAVNAWDPKTYIRDLSHLATFRVAVEHWDELAAYCRAVDRRFPSIDTFQCHWEGAYFSLSRDSGALSVPEIGRFRQVHLTVNARHNHWVQVHQIVLWWGYTFRNVQVDNSIETITFSFPMRFPLAPGSEEVSWWNTLDSLLADQRFARLRTVHLEPIKYRNNTTFDRLTVKPRVEVAFPNLCRRAIIRF
ncbi:hypothetical protein DFS33DRAFT_523381 [Desarmillaria ectypa]|nr:hypothetical protein DFS33DRAFT_523381 [Desarmillaria ectypa]